MKCIFSWFVIIAVILVVIWVGFQKTHTPVVVPNDVENISNPPKGKLSPETANTVSSMIEVTSPTHNGAITSPLTVTGRARGPWYFEASFPIELKDGNGAVIATAVAQAQGDWMTENWVPFSATLNYPPQPTGSTGTLVLKKDNPSGESQNDMSLIVPVQF